MPSGEKEGVFWIVGRELVITTELSLNSSVWTDLLILFCLLGFCQLLYMS